MIDSYTIYAVSVLAATALFRAFFGAAFPLFTTQMYDNLGIHWASSIPAFLTLVCVPFPIVMYRYGATIRLKCKYAREAAFMLGQMERRHEEEAEVEEAKKKAVDGPEEVQRMDMDMDMDRYGVQDAVLVLCYNCRFKAQGLSNEIYIIVSNIEK